jgi:hypothetical protein
MMLRRGLLLVCVGAVVLGTAGVALAAAVKVKLMPYPAANPIEPNASGRAVLNYTKGSDKTIVQVNCWGLMPNSEYTVWLSPSPGNFHVVGSFVTDYYGEGHLHAFLPGDHSGHVPVAVNNAANMTVLLGS